MSGSWFVRPLRSRRTVAAIAAGAILCIGVTAASASPGALRAPQVKRLSLSSIVLGGGFNGDFNLAWIAQKAGIFKKLGLTVGFKDVETGNADVVSGAIAGAYQFMDTANSGLILSAQQGFPIRAVASVNLSAPETIALSSSVATAKNIPFQSNTVAQVKAQFLALKGSHVTIGVSNTTALSYNYFVDLAKQYGISISGTNPDVNIVSLGSVNNLVPGMLSGKIDGFMNSPPTTIQPNTISIPYWKLPPASNAAGLYMATTTAMINSHPDTVQALVDGLELAAIYVKQHYAAAARFAPAEYAQIGITSPEIVTSLFADLSSHWSTILPTKQAYDNAVAIINSTQPSIQATMPYTTFVIAKFALAAVKKYGPIPK